MTANTTFRAVARLLVVAGNTLTVTGCVGLVLGSTALIPFELFAIGLSSGIRVIGSVAIAGCLLSATGYGIVDYLEK